MAKPNRFSELETELMLQINERLFQKGLLTREIYEAAKVKIVRHT